MNGVLSRANLWVNGTKVADQSQLQGAYSQLEFDITPYVRDGSNAIALDVFKNDSSNSGYLTLNMVDWNPDSPDGWTGLQFAPQLAQDGAISVRNAHVVEDNAPDLRSSEITVKADLRNNTDTAQAATFSGSIAGSGEPHPVQQGGDRARGHDRDGDAGARRVPAAPDQASGRLVAVSDG